MLDVKKIEPRVTYSLRHKILRPHQSIEDSKFDTDFEDHAFHVGAFYQERFISVATFLLDNNPDFPVERQYRLRQMATLEEFRNFGAGRAIVNYAENLIKEQSVYFLWCKARTKVQEYYNKLGFSTHGEVFDYPPIGPHIVMYKSLR